MVLEDHTYKENVHGEKARSSKCDIKKYKMGLQSELTEVVGGAIQRMTSL